MDREGKIPTSIVIAQPSLASLVDVDHVYGAAVAKFSGASVVLAEKDGIEKYLEQLARVPGFLS